MHPGSTNPITFKELQRDFACSFDVYAAKDEMCVVSLDDKDSYPKHLRAVIASGATFKQLSQILDAAQDAKEMALASAGRNNGAEDKDKRYDPATIINLQRRWRRILPKIKELRLKEETLEGSLEIQVQELCAKLTRESAAHGITPVSMLCARAFLLGDALPIQVQLARIPLSIQQEQHEVKLALTAMEDVEELEKFAGMTKQLGDLETKFQCVEEAWSLSALEQTILNRPLRDQTEMVAGTQAIIRLIWKDIRVIRQEVAAAQKSRGKQVEV